MTMFFVRKFKSTNECYSCRKDKLSGYSLCSKHLEKARAQFETWAIVRRHEGLCCFCDCKSFNGWLRCRRHTTINRARILAWNRANPEHSKQEWAKRQTLRRNGFCPQCAQHRKLRGDAGRCWVCSLRNSLRDKLGIEGMKAEFRSRYGTKFDRKLKST